MLAELRMVKFDTSQNFLLWFEQWIKVGSKSKSPCYEIIVEK